MATDLRSIRADLYATPLDVRLMSSGVIGKQTHGDTIDVDDARAEMFLLRARGIIDLKLASVIDSSSDLEVTPYQGSVLIPKAAYDETTTAENDTTTPGILYGFSSIASGATTELWTLTFTTTTAYTITGSFSGSQGTGATDGAADSTSTNGDITIPNDVWSGSPAVGDIFYVPVYKHQSSIVLLATMLATGLLFKSISLGVGIADNQGAKLYDDAIDLLDSIVETGALPDLSLALDTTDMQVPWAIDLAGYDETKYKSEEYEMTYTSNYSWYDRWIS